VRKALIAILFATVALGAILRPVSAQENLSKAERRQLIRKGAMLWGVYCNQCHNARPGSEKAPYEWDQEIMHMRTLGNIPAADARAIVQYLKTR
jgi:mono/diheme cytochrome c family protein